MKDSKFKGECGVIAEVKSIADAICFFCPKCNKIHNFDRIKTTLSNGGTN